MTTLIVSSPQLTQRERDVYIYICVYVYIYIKCIYIYTDININIDLVLSCQTALKERPSIGSSKTPFMKPWPLARRCGDLAVAAHIAAYPAQHFLATAGLFTSRPRPKRDEIALRSWRA